MPHKRFLFSDICARACSTSVLLFPFHRGLKVNTQSYPAFTRLLSTFGNDPEREREYVRWNVLRAKLFPPPHLSRWRHYLFVVLERNGRYITHITIPILPLIIHFIYSNYSWLKLSSFRFKYFIYLRANRITPIHFFNDGGTGEGDWMWRFAFTRRQLKYFIKQY